jgi:hypothetical protein
MRKGRRVLRPHQIRFRGLIAIYAMAERIGDVTRAEPGLRLPSVPATFSASSRRSSERVPPVRRASSGSFGNAKRSCAGESVLMNGCLRAGGMEDTSMLLLVFGTEFWKRV